MSVQIPLQSYMHVHRIFMSLIQFAYYFYNYLDLYQLSKMKEDIDQIYQEIMHIEDTNTLWLIFENSLQTLSLRTYHRK